MKYETKIVKEHVKEQILYKRYIYQQVRNQIIEAWGTFPPSENQRTRQNVLETEIELKENQIKSAKKWVKTYIKEVEQYEKELELLSKLK